MKDRSHGWALGVSFLLLLIVVVVTAQSEKNKTTVVTHLPGFHGPLPFSLEAGYVEVDNRNGVRLFYYFVQSETSPAEDPVLLWLTGGPGCSAFSGLVYEIGPLSFQPDSYAGGLPALVHKPDSWTKVANVIFLDSPVGAGFSYSATHQGYRSCDTKAVDQIAIFLTKTQGNQADDAISGTCNSSVLFCLLKTQDEAKESTAGAWRRRKAQKIRGGRFSNDTMSLEF